jgi:RNA recognition motif-containing protein
MQESGAFRVFVKGLAPEVTVDDLYQLFSKYGKILHIRSGRSGYAFIDFADERDALIAIRELDGTMLAGFKILVEESHRSRGDNYQQKLSHSHRSQALTPPISPRGSPQQMSSFPPFHGDSKRDYFAQREYSGHSYENIRMSSAEYLRDPRDVRSEHEYRDDRDSRLRAASRRSRSPLIHSHRYEPYPERERARASSSSRDYHNRVSFERTADMRYRPSSVDPIAPLSSSSSYSLRYARTREEEPPTSNRYSEGHHSLHSSHAHADYRERWSPNSPFLHHRDDRYRRHSPHREESRERDRRYVTTNQEVLGSSSASYYRPSHATEPQHHDRPPSPLPPSRTRESSHRHQEYERLSGISSHMLPMSSHEAHDNTRYSHHRYHHNDRFAEQQSASHTPRHQKYLSGYGDENRDRRKRDFWDDNKDQGYDRDRARHRDEREQKQEQEPIDEREFANIPQFFFPVVSLPYNIYSHTYQYSASSHFGRRGRSAEPVPRVLRPSLNVLLPIEVEYNLRHRRSRPHREEIRTPDHPPSNQLSPQQPSLQTN